MSEIEIPKELTELRPEDIAKARTIVSELCHGNHQWRMCVPPQRDDSDMVLSRILTAADKWLAENAPLRRE